MADTDDLPPEEIEARMKAGLKKALRTPPAERAKKKRPGQSPQPSA